MSSNELETRRISINVDELRDLVGIGIRRASAFVRLGLDGLNDKDLAEFNLTSSIVYQFWPAEISAEHRKAAREEYRSWLIGSCLREVDLFFGLFLDRVWHSIEAIELHGILVPPDYTFDKKFSRKTNVADKNRLVTGKLRAEDHYEALNSLSLARNALTHHAGIVRSPFDCNNEARDTLSVKWLSLEMFARRDGEEIIVEHSPFDQETLPGKGTVQIGVQVKAREISFPAGHQVVFTNSQLAELCMFYRILSDKVIDGLLRLLEEKGLFSTKAKGETLIQDQP